MNKLPSLSDILHTSSTILSKRFSTLLLKNLWQFCTISIMCLLYWWAMIIGLGPICWTSSNLKHRLLITNYKSSLAPKVRIFLLLRFATHYWQEISKVPTTCSGTTTRYPARWFMVTVLAALSVFRQRIYKLNHVNLFLNRECMPRPMRWLISAPIQP